MADPGFPRRGCQPNGGVTNPLFGHFLLKLHKIFKQLDKDGVHVPCAPLDLTM